MHELRWGGVGVGVHEIHFFYPFKIDQDLTFELYVPGILNLMLTLRGHSTREKAQGGP